MISHKIINIWTKYSSIFKANFTEKIIKLKLTILLLLFDVSNNNNLWAYSYFILIVLIFYAIDNEEFSLHHSGT